MKNEIRELMIPPIGFGTWKLEGKTGEAAIETALELGYRHIDTAQMYYNEALVGNVLNRLRPKRQEIFITTKLHNEIRGYQETIDAVYQSLELLKVDYLDLVLIHWPKPRKYLYDWESLNIKSWEGLEYLFSKGLIKYLGVSNFLQHHMEALINNITIQPSVNQIEYHPYYVQDDIKDYCFKRNILVEAWSALGNGRCLSSPVLAEIAGHYEKSIAQICVSYAVKKGLIPIVKASSYEHIKDNINGLDLQISEEDMAAIDSLDNTIRVGRHPDDE